MPSHELFDFELRLREQFARLKAPDEVIAFAGAHKRDLIPELRSSVSLVMISVFGEQGKLRWYVGDTMERYYHRTVFEAELAEIREFISVTTSVKSLVERRSSSLVALNISMSG